MESYNGEETVTRWNKWKTKNLPSRSAENDFLNQNRGVWSETYRSATWGPFVLIQLDNDAISCDGRDEERVGDEWLGSASHLLSTNGIDTSLTHVCRRDYTINCNWKVQFFQDTRLLFTTQVFCDNYLDGGYHVPCAHQGLAFGLDLSSYKTFVCISYYDEFFFPSATLAIM